MFFAAASKARKFGVSCIFGVLLAISSPLLHARQSDLQVNAGEVVLASLPREASATHALILDGGPFPFEKDGVAFGNRERLLPLAKRGFYREYTVKTPGMRHRGARRIVCGGAARTPQACYYTSDHYASFRKILN